MKRFYAACALLLVLLGLILLNSWRSGSLTAQAAQELTQAQEMAGRGAWDDALKVTERVFSDWEGHSFYFHSTTRHTEMDEILRSFREVLEYLRLQQSDEYMAANAGLVTRLELLGEMEEISLSNIL